MPVVIRVDKEAGIVYTTIDGAYTAEDVLAAFEVLLANPDFQPGMNGIADLRNAKTFLSATDVMRVARYLIEHRNEIGKSKTAVLVSSDVSVGTTRMFQAYSDDRVGIETRIFHELDEAHRWLGLDD